ncbi:MAG: D-alanyl-D-alanine carboxypeptidase [Chloracidobacterium sp.]|nr:D-alanyl-D-alanine carboxypeptidase [Chloracidobacterium sp.]
MDTASGSATSANVVRTLFPALADVSIPGYSGVLVESLAGSVVIESNSTQVFNPASNVMVATAYAVLKTFGPEFRFSTSVYTDGAIDRTTGRLNGNVYVSGKDPMFGYQHAITLANELNKIGIRSVTGDLIVTDNFAMNYSGSSLVSGQSLLASMDASRRSAAATRAWLNYLSYSGKYGQASTVPSVTFTGSVYAQPIPGSLHLLFTHESAPIREIIKATLCYSNNFLAERLGEMLGGPYAVARLVQLNANIPPVEFSIQTSSGLGYNRVTPNAMMLLLRALRSELARYKMAYSDIMPVAGIDKGTLENRFATAFSAGSVVGQAGSFGTPDAGVSSLSGEISTRNGKYLFVILNQRGSVTKFQAFQHYFVPLVQKQFGGPAPMAYDTVSLETRLARSRVHYPNQQCSQPLYLLENEDFGYDTLKPIESSSDSKYEYYSTESFNGRQKVFVKGNVRTVLLSREIQNIRIGDATIRGYKILILNSDESVLMDSNGNIADQTGGAVFDTGYVSCTNFRAYYTKKGPGESPFVKESLDDSYSPPTVTVKNDSAHVLTLLINETRYVISPGATREITLPAGRYKFVATAPNVIPLVGTEAWDAGYRYTWTFYTERVIR